MNRHFGKMSLACVGLLFVSGLVSAEQTVVSIDSSTLVKSSDTAIDAIIAVQDAVDAVHAKDPNATAKVLPLPAGTVRNDAFNREMPWLAKGKSVTWAGPRRTGGDNEDGSHLFRTERRSDGKDHPWWYERMKEKRDEIRASDGTFDIVMMGDSITHWWDRDFGKDVMPDLRKTYSILNLGYGGDKADTLLWRVRNGELEGYKAKVFTIMVGTNNHVKDRDTPERTAKTIGEIVATVREKQPQAKILLMRIFPRSSPEQGRLRTRSLAVSRLIEKYADGKNVFWRDYTPLFVKEDGTGRYDLLEDGTHPTSTGIRVWYEAMLPDFERFTGKRHVLAAATRVPCPRRWISCSALATDDAACTAFNDLVARAQWMGYTGVCADLFDKAETWDKAAEARVCDAVGACRDAGLDFIPVLRPQEQPEAFDAVLGKVRTLADPSVVFLSTNGAAVATREALRPLVVREIGQVAKALPKAEIVVFGRPFAGYASGIPPTVTVATDGEFGYFRNRKWPVMLLVDAENKYVRLYNMHTTVMNFMNAYQCQGSKEGLLYWTSTGDYRMAVDAARLGLRQE